MTKTIDLRGALVVWRHPRRSRAAHERFQRIIRDYHEALCLTLAPRVRAALRQTDRLALIAEDGHTPAFDYLTSDDLADLDSLILFALACVLDHSPRGDAYLVTAARNLLRSQLRAARALKRHLPDGAVLVSIDDPDSPVVVASIEASPLDVLLAREDVPDVPCSAKPLAKANARLRLKKRALPAHRRRDAVIP
jgi:hypothetical protein